MRPKTSPPQPLTHHTTQPRLPHRPALDGLRGLAVAGVVLYHLDLPWMPGGFLGVSLFFTLSGFLITNLLLAEGDGGTIDLRRFWARRARRLLPASLAALALVCAYGWYAASADQLAALRHDVAAALGYVANWRFLLTGDAYGAGYRDPSPLQHFWSLAIEEQFYVVYPLVAAGLVRLRFGRRGWTIVLGALAAASAAATLLAHGDASRVYYGTHTRAFEMLAGALLAVAIRTGAPTRWTTLGGRRHVLPLGALVVTIGAWATIAVSDSIVHRGGLLALSLVSCALLLGSVDSGPLSWLLDRSWLRTLGAMSYGIYLYHGPLFRWLTTERTGLDGPMLVAVRLGATAAATVVSYQLVEQPMRSGRIRLRVPQLAVAVPAVVAVLLLSSTLAGNRAAERAVDLELASSIVVAHVDAPTERTVPTRRSVPATSTTGAAPAAHPSRSPSTSTSTPARTPASLRRVLFLGDSLVHQSLAGIETVFARAGIDVRAVGGPGQTLLADRASWLADLRRSVDDFDPDVVVLEGCCGFGNADPAPYIAPDGRVLPVDSPALYEEWAAVAREATAIAGPADRLVGWVLAPPAGTNGYYGPIEQRIGVVNDLYRRIAACDGRVALVDWGVVAAPDGSFAAALPTADGTDVEVRHADGLHLTPAGVALVAQRTLETIRAELASVRGVDDDDVQCDGAVDPERQ